ncbi:MAG: hypothetical protein DSZ30_06135, partial [Aquificaceae bacterium]
ALEIYKDILRQIQFADTKAGLILAWHGASLGFLSKIVTDNLQKIITVGLKVLTLTSFSCSLILALLSIGFAFWVVLPRLKDTSCQRECMFWVYHISCEDFEKDLQRFKENIENPERVLDCLSRSVVATAEILKRKYENLRKSLILLALALLPEVITILTIALAS